jgi:hypothetical protein
MPDQDDIEEAVVGLLAANASSPGAAVPVIATMAKAYTRGRGFDGNEPNDEIAAVITTASARLASNTAQVSQNQTMGDFGRDVRSSFQGWTVAEQMVLDRYRVKAM